MQTEPSTPHEILAHNLTQSGYGMSRERAASILGRLTEDEIEDLTYLIRRTAEKYGYEAISCEEAAHAD